MTTALDRAIKVLARAGAPKDTFGKIVTAHGGASRAAAAVAADPYGALADVVPIEVVDRVAVAFGVSLGDRAAGHAAWLIADRARAGHSSVSTSFATARLRFAMELPEVTVREGIAAAVRGGKLIAVAGGLTTPKQRQKDTGIAQEIARRRRAAPHPAVADALRTPPGTLSEPQLAALRVVSRSLLSVITGGPGTGKSEVVRTAVEACLVAALEVRVTAPTGRAARNTSGRTVHYFKAIQELGKNEFRDAALIIVDEASMLTTDLMAVIFELAPRGAHILLVGDVDQLPPVGVGDVLRDVIDTGACPVVRLEENFRSTSGICQFASGVLHGRIEGLGDTDEIELVECETYDGVLDAAAPLGCVILTPHNVTRLLLNKATQMYRRLADGELEITLARDFPDHPRGTEGLASMDAATGMIDIVADGGLAIRATLRAAVDLVVASSSEVRGGVLTEGDMAIRPDDRVIVTKNMPCGVCNGDTGTMVSSSSRGTRVLLDDDRGEVLIPHDAQGTVRGVLTLAYAITVHKAQGSEFDVVALPLVNHGSWDRSLLYTACTRAKKKVILLGTRDALEAIVRSERPRRTTTLRDLLVFD